MNFKIIFDILFFMCNMITIAINVSKGRSNIVPIICAFMILFTFIFDIKLFIDED
jgi:hypothetical protein